LSVKLRQAFQTWNMVISAGYIFRQALKTLFIAFAVFAGLVLVFMFIYLVFLDKAVVYLKNGTSEVISESRMEFASGEAVSFGSLEPGAFGRVKISNSREGDASGVSVTSRINVRFGSGKTLEVDTPIYFVVRNYWLVTPDDIVDAWPDGKKWLEPVMDGDDIVQAQ